MAAPARNFSKIRRSRPSYSCESCRARRVKCDQVYPKCTNCSRNEIDCVYTATTQKRKDAPGDAAKSESAAKAARRKAGDEDAHYKHGYLSLQNGGRSRYIENTFWACVDVEGLELDSLLSDLPLFPLEDVCCTADDNRNNADSLASCRHYIGTTEPNFSFWVSQRPTTIGSNERSLASTLAELPSRATCDYLYQTFVKSVHPLVPLVHLTTFDALYQRFWDWHRTWRVGDVPDGVLAEIPSFLPLLLAVMFTGSIACLKIDATSAMCSSPEMQKKLYNMMSSALTLVGFPHSPALYSLMAFVLVKSMLIREEESLSSCSFVAVALRISQAMGLHKDGTNFGLDDVQIEERRRIWCHLMHLDVMTSIVSGLPLVASSEMFSNTRMIGELRDEYIGKVEVTENISGGSITDPNYVLTVGRYDASSCIRSVLLQQFSPSPIRLAWVKSTAANIEQLRIRMEERIRRLNLQHCEEPTNPSNPSPSASSGDCGAEPKTGALECWAEDLLRLMVEKAYCILYQPAMRELSLWAELRAEAIPRFQSFLSIFIRMCTTISYLPFQWLYPGAYQPLQPVAVLLVDLLQEPHSPEAQESRVLLEKIFSLLGPGGRIMNVNPSVAAWPDQRYASKGAKQAWARLEKLRSKVWQKLGLDASVLWTRTIGEINRQSESVDAAGLEIPAFEMMEQGKTSNDDHLLHTDLQNVQLLATTDEFFGASHPHHYPTLEGQIAVVDSPWQIQDPQWQAPEFQTTQGDVFSQSLGLNC